MGIILAEDGTYLLDEAEGVLLDEAGSPFPELVLDLDCDLDLGGTWTDVSSYVYQREGDSPPVALERGRQDESSNANPGSAAWEWNNRDGRFSPKNPLSPYYGQLGRNTPVRFSVPAQANYLRLEDDNISAATCPASSALNITGDIDIRVDVDFSGYQLNYQGAANVALVTKYGGPSGTNNSWFFGYAPSGLLFSWYDGTTLWLADPVIPPPPRGRQCLRVTLAHASGTVTFYTGPAGGCTGSTWTQLGSTVSPTSGASTSIATSTADVSVGNNTSGALIAISANGSYYEAAVYSGIAGTLEAHPVFSSQTAGTTSFADAESNTWTLYGTAEISSRDYRWHGQMSAQPPVWDVTGNDMAVNAQAGGLLRLISQGQAPLMSPVKRGYLLLPASEQLVAYWPAEDATGAASFGSAIGGQPMYWSGPPTLADSSSFIASNPLPVVNGATFTGQVPAYTGGTACVFRFLISEAAASIANNAAIAIMRTTGTVAGLTLFYQTGGNLVLTGYSSGGSQLFTSGAVSFGLDGNPWLIEMVLNTSGSSIAWAMNAMAPGAASQGGYSGTLTSASPGNVTSVTVNPGGGLGQVTMGHFAVQSFYNSLQLNDFSQPLNANIGETAATRFARLAGENGYAARIVGAPAASAAMGAQAIDTLSNLLQACEDADDGQIFEPRQALALGYRTRASMYSQSPQVTLNYTQSQPGGLNGGAGDSGLDPTYDDQLTRNDWTLTRTAGTGPDGSTVQYQLNDGSGMSISPPPAGVGDYADTLSVNVEYDAQLLNLASWKVHAGTVDQARWPVIPVNLARTAIQNASLYYPVLNTDIGDLIEITDIPDVVTYDPVKQLVSGAKESLGGFHHAVEWNAVPELPYEVAIATTAHADTAGSQLHANYTYGGATFQVDVTAGNLWTTVAGDFPFNIDVSGMEITVTNITGSSSPQTFYVTPGVNGVQKNLAAGAAVGLWNIPVAAL